MTVVRNEFERGENSPQGVLRQRIYAAAFGWHNYGKSTIGNRSDIERVPIENLRAFYRKLLSADNVVLIIAGKFEPAKALALSRKHLGAIPRPKRILKAAHTEEPAQDGERLVVLRRVARSGRSARLPHPGRPHADWAPLSLLAGILTQQPNAGFTRRLSRPKRRPAAARFADNTNDPGLFSPPPG